jgi:hypothetical protein
MTQEQADYVEDVSTGTDINLLSIQVIADLKIGYAAIQNNIPVIREILVTNNGETTLCAAELVVKSVPTFAESARFHFDRLAAWRVGVSPLTSVRTTNISISSMNLSEPLLPHRYAFRRLYSQRRRTTLIFSLTTSGQVPGRCPNCCRVLYA